MTFIERAFPWMFRRDEIDLLEEDLDDLYDLHTGGSEETETMEQAIILEQLETEDQAYFAFEKQFNPFLFFDQFQKNVPSLTDEYFLELDTERPILYEHIFRYADEVNKHVTELYARDREKKEHAFRAQVNSKMIPIKCAIAFCEETYDDPLALVRAKNEFTLACIYLDRLLYSLASLTALGDRVSLQALKTGVLIKKFLEEKISRFPL